MTRPVPARLKPERPVAPVISVIVPYYNESEVLTDCHHRLMRVLSQLDDRSEIVYVDDGSSDDSSSCIDAALHRRRSHRVAVQSVRLSRNFGKEAALSAGLRYARGQAVVILDADLQDPPELIPLMIKQWRQGFAVVNMRRCSRAGESWVKRTTAASYYWLMNSLSETAIPANVGDFRLLDRVVVDAVNRLPERGRYMKGLFAWPGYRQTIIDYDREVRAAGSSKWDYPRLISLAFEGITSFSIKPLRLATLCGLFVSLAALGLALGMVIKTLVFGDPVAGYPSLITVVLLFSGVQLLAIGLLGEYVGRLFIEAKQRPLYLVETHRQYSRTDGELETAAVARKSAA
ncbi:glycosyltransferase family 2 protein [Gammaproteobacteria bacterium]|nr:glycosyltransferase family 2 protein [Gammaproteobacteria bacterium]